jgi:serine/threonine-protein kinase RsbW
MEAPTTTDFPSDGAPSVLRATLRFSAQLAYRPLAIALVSALISQVEGASREFRNEVVTAFGEAFNNIVIHGYRGRSDGMVDLEADIAPDRISLRILDTGREVDFKEVEPPDLLSMPEGGLGVFMIHALVDEVVYRGGVPNVLLLTKRTTLHEESR